MESSCPHACEKQFEWHLIKVSSSVEPERPRRRTIRFPICPDLLPYKLFIFKYETM